MADCEYWKNIVSQLRNSDKCVRAAHVLAALAGKADSNLQAALKCLTAEEIIENTIFAYRDWDAQPYCDEILFQFERRKINEVFERIESPGENMKKGVLELWITR